MNHILLIGAGFSHNWGGRLTADIFRDLLGSAAASDPYCKQLLWQHRAESFEKALGILQRQGGPSLDTMERGIREVFDNMDREFTRTGFTLEFREGANADPEDNIKAFLARFDAIFSLNQDLLLESGYFLQADPPQAFNQRWHGYSLPGMTPRVSPAPLLPYARWLGEYCPDPTAQGVAPPPGHQPLYKLHGSTNWADSQAGRRLLVMGGEKTDTINGSATLKAYLREFERRLNEPNTRLMVIGYGFNDDHITSAIERAAAAGNLGVFVIDPWGEDAPDRWKHRTGAIKVAGPQNAIQAALIGASKLGLNQTFGGNTIERNAVLKFFK